MSDLIQDLHNDNISVSSLLRRAKILGTKINQPEFLAWVNLELNGYGEKDKYPDYRKVSGEVKFWNPQLGWCPVIFPNSKVEEQITNRYANQSVAAIEELLSRNSDNYQMQYSASVAKRIMEGGDICVNTKVSLFIDRSALTGILSVVRNSLIDYVLRFKKEGINLEEVDKSLEPSQIFKIINLLDFKLRKTIRTTPTDEKEIRDALENLLIGADISYTRETESIVYSTKTYIPDFSIEKEDLVIETKISNKKEREKQMIAEINDDILAYKTKHKNLIFVVYDIGFIRDVERFSKHFEDQEGVIVKVIKH